MKVLFVCNLGMTRSRTAADMFKDRFETRFRGVQLNNPVKDEDLVWADRILVMEDDQKNFILQKNPLVKKKISVLDIPDVYYYNQPELVSILKTRVEKMLK